ncbi:MAG: PD40 domain-containing protein [Chloroflexi bacterium]|nr:PD40 domain-containing protein [Chloroflexota bacterium]
MSGRRWAPFIGALAMALLVVACGPNALPRADVASAEVATSPPSADAPRTGAIVPSAPIAQLFGGGSTLEGRLLFTQQGDLWIWEKGAARALAVGYTWRQPKWAPDGARFVYVYRGNSFSDIFVTDVENKAPRRLTTSQSQILNDNDWNLRPAWSPDGRQIAYASDTSSANPLLWVLNAADGTGRRQVQTGLNAWAIDAIAWSPDGSRVAVAAFIGVGTSQIATVPMNASARPGATVLTNYAAGALDPAWSPDGAWIAYSAREGRQVNVYAMRADGTQQARLTNVTMARAPEWSPDGRRLAYLSAESGTFEVWVVDVVQKPDGGLEARDPRQVTRDIGLDAPSGVTWTK